jgi:hypothetical protein
VHVIETHIAANKREIEVTLIGPRLPQSAIAAMETKLGGAGLQGAHLVVHQAEDTKVDVGSLKADILAEIVKNSQQALQERDDTIAALRKQLAEQVATRQDWIAGAGDIAREFAAQFPQCAGALVGQVALADGSTAPLLSATCRRLPAPSQVKQAQEWFRVRTKSSAARLLLAR